MNPPHNPAEVVTNPDPTTAVKEALELAIKNLSHEMDLRVDAMEKASNLAREQLKEKLEALASSINDKFGANEKLVSQLATATKDLVDQLAKANAVALAAALSTQKESASKFELNVGDLLKGLASNFETAIKATNEKIEVLRSSVISLTSRLDLGQGGFNNRIDNRREDREDTRDTAKAATDNRSFIVAAIAAAIAAAALFFAFSTHK